MRNSKIIIKIFAILLMVACVFIPCKARAVMDRDDISTPDPVVKFVEAVMKDDVDAVEKLLKRGIDVNAKTQSGATPLLMASLMGKLEMAELLIDLGADVDYQGQYGETALIYAVEYHHPVIVKLLIDNGANPDFRDESGKNALDFAKKFSDDNMIKLLEDYINIKWKEGKGKRLRGLLKDLNGPMPQNDEEEEVRMEVVSQIVSMGVEVIPTLLDTMKGDRGFQNSDMFIQIILTKFGKAAVKPMIAALQDETPKSQLAQTCLEALRRLREDAKEASDILVALFNKLPEFDKETLTGRNYLKALAAINPEVLPEDVRNFYRAKDWLNKSISDAIQESEETKLDLGVNFR